MWNFLIRFSKYHRTQNQKGSTNIIIAPQVPISTLSREANRTCKQIKKYTFLCASHVCNTAAAHYRVRPEWTSPAQKFHCPSAGWDTHSRNIPNNLFICLYFWHVELIRNSPPRFGKRNNKTVRPRSGAGGAQNISSKFVSSAQKFSRPQEVAWSAAPVSVPGGWPRCASSAEVAAHSNMICKLLLLPGIKIHNLFINFRGNAASRVPRRVGLFRGASN